MIKVTNKEIDQVLRLPGPERYSYFIKRICDTETLWGLYDSGWGLVSDEENNVFIPFWPYEEFAKLSALDNWCSYKPESIEIHYFLNTLLPYMKEEGILPCIFLTPSDKGVCPSYEQLTNDLKEELKNYE